MAGVSTSTSSTCMYTLQRSLLIMVVMVIVASHSATLCSGQHTYAVTFPCTVHPGQATVVNIALFGGSGDVSVHAELQAVGGNPLGAADVTIAARSEAQISVPTPESIKTGSSLMLVVTGTGGLTFTNKTTVMAGSSFSIFVQTDKGAYRPGQTVRMRVVTVQPDLKPYSKTFNVHIADNSKNRLAQWLNVQPVNGIWSEDFPISEYPPLGNYTIEVNASTAQTSTQFEVREYVLPKFTVSVSTVPYVANDESSDIVAFISAQYTYGKAVEGTAKVELFLNNVYQYCSGRSNPRISRQVTLTAGKNASVTLTRAQFNSLFCSSYGFGQYYRGYQQLVVNASVTDLVTGETRHSSSSAGLYYISRQMEVDSSVSPASFKPGTKYPLRILVSTPDKKPISGASVDIRVWRSADSISTTTLLSTNGVINHLIDVPKSSAQSSMNIRISPTGNTDYYQTIRFNPSRAFTTSGSYLQLSASKANYATGETASFTATAIVDSSKTIFSKLVYTVHSRGTLVHRGTVIPTAGSMVASFSFAITPAMGPYAKVLAYYVAQGEFVVDSLSVGVSGVFENNVQVSFGQAEARPNDNVTLTVSAEAGSTVAVSIVDQSALLVRQANTITASGVSEELAQYDKSGRPVYYDGPVWALAEPAIWNRRRRRRTVLPGPWYYGGATASSVLHNAGMCIISDLNVPKSRYSSVPNYLPGGGDIQFGLDVQETAFSGSGSSNTRTEVGESLAVPDHTRDFFPETWLWATANASASGTAEFETVVPDSITSWVASAFAVSPSKGMGVAPSTVKLRAFQEFFISLNLPYSVIQGEELVLQVNVFNYLDTSQETLVTLDSTPSLKVTGANAGQAASKTITVLAGKAQSALFIVKPTISGRLPITVTARAGLAADRVIRQLLVEPEGVTKSYSHGVFIDLTNTGSMTEKLLVSLPTEGLVPGSARAVISVVGDIMGPALSNLDKLLTMPYGCGEQNMIAFAPDVFITRYLTASRMTTGSILAKAKRFMMSGYQRELRYWRNDYSFSAFGKRDKVGSLWLTAFVVKSFSQASPYIYVDPTVISKSLQFILRQQASAGSFQQVGMVHHSGLKGGLQGDVARTAYILTALIEARNAQVRPSASLTSAISSAQSYLGSQLSLVTDNYTLALSAYALKLSDSSLASQALTLLLARADRTGGTLSWQDSRKKTVTSRWRSPYYRAPSADVELTAYGLLALVLHKRIADASAVARWLSSQRNSYGGFDSTQDTVVGLQALADFAMLVSATPPTMNINIASEGGASAFSQSFSVNSVNSLVLQQTEDFPVPSTLALSATGSGTVVLSIAVFYNLYTDDVNAYTMDTDCSLWKQGERLGATCKYCTRAAATTYADTGMSLLEISLPSGFNADMDTVSQALSREPMVGRVETPDRRVIFYLDEIGTSDTCLTFDILQSLIVGHLQPSAIRTINYYSPAVSNARLYNVSAEVIPLCCQCPTCDTCSSASTVDCPQLSARPTGSGSAAVRPAVIVVTAVFMLGGLTMPGLSIW
ncbi:CD109 antigen-like [Sycon ciliatum]|uniref:CD109 antigen-like n=1 Tax=Sycon ciliatum TaxID=27933 RepID=UPI0031F61302